MTHAVYLRQALSALILCGLLLSSPHVHAQTLQEQTVHNFQGPTTDGNFCQSRLLDADVHGTELLYGTTSRGGANGHGTIFFLNPITHVETILYSFPMARPMGKIRSRG